MIGDFICYRHSKEKLNILDPDGFVNDINLSNFMQDNEEGIAFEGIS